MFKCCMCCKKYKIKKEKLKYRNNLYSLAQKKLYGELNILEIISNHRIGRFIHKLFIKKYQRELIRYFKIYNAEHLACKENKQYTPNFYAGKLNFDLETD